MSRSFADIFMKTETASDTLILPGELSERFNVRECLAKNDFGEAYLLNEIGNSTPYILKCYRKSQSYQIHETEIMRGLDCDGLAKIAAEFDSKNTLYVLREYAVGVPLNEFVNERGFLDETLVIRLTVKLCDILTYLHNQPDPIIHRDIKPSNIIVNPKDNKVTLIDFGIARKYSKAADTDTMYFGTEKFAAPEQYGFSQTDARTDIYSAGVVIRYMLTGSTGGQVTDEYMARIIEKCTAFAPKDRYQSGEALKRALLAYNDRTRRKVMYIIAAVASICVVFAAVFFISRYVDSFRSPTTESSVNAVHVFSDTLIEKAVRASLGKSEDVPIKREELKGVYGLYIIGDKVFANAEEAQANEDAPVSYGSLKDISDLLYMENLKGFHIARQPIEDISPLSECSNLSGVVFQFCESLHDISPLEACTMLTQAHIIYCDISDLSPLAGLPLLDRLHIQHNPNIDLTSLKNMESLKALKIAGASLQSISELNGVNHIVELVIQQTPLKSLDGIERFTSMSILDLAKSEFITDFSPLNELSVLKELKINSNMETSVQETLTRSDLQITVVE